MKTGLDCYCFHRFFGDWYPELQRDPGRRITIWELLERAPRLGLEGISLEACYLPEDEAFLARLAEALDTRGLMRVWAWGHPDGLGSGSRPEALEDLVRHTAIARRLGADTMRICCGSRRTRPESWAAHKAALLPLLQRGAEAAARQGVVLAVENHIDLLADELLELLEAVNSPALGICLDTANNRRMGEDPLEVARKLAPLTRATHVKNVAHQAGAGSAFASWPATPLDQGEIDIAAILRVLAGAGYDGLLGLEIDYLHPRFGEDEEPAIAASLAWLRGTVAEIKVGR
jgi:sugar phosphate isomerase/epimerase